MSVVLVHYHTPELAAAAVEAVQTDLRTAGLEGEIVLVDNGNTIEGRRLLRSLGGVRLVEPGENLGYAGGVDLGADETAAPVLVLMNPDVVVQPGCLARLVAELQAGAAAVGPLFTWDGIPRDGTARDLDSADAPRPGRLLLPPPERRRRFDDLLAVLASRGPRWARRARRRWRRHARAHWTATSPRVTHSLSGALLAVGRPAWNRIGPFDPSYPLYFEETDWLERLAAASLPARLVPAARAVHLHDQSAVAEPRAREWFGISERRFRRRWYGAAFTVLLEVVTPATPNPRLEADAGPLRPAGEPLRLDELGNGGAAGGASLGAALWVELSPRPEGFPAAAERLEASRWSEPWTLPAEIRHRLPAGTVLHLRLVDSSRAGGLDGRELARLRLEVA